MWESISDSITDHDINLESTVIEDTQTRSQEIFPIPDADDLNYEKEVDAELISPLDIIRIHIIRRIKERGVLAYLRDKKGIFPISPRYFPRSPRYDILTFSHISALFSHISAFLKFYKFYILSHISALFLFFPYLRVFSHISAFL
jgi:hypothetical protein